MIVDPPSLSDVKKRLEDLLATRQSRADVSAWAMRWLTDDSRDPIDDRVVWGLARLGAVELRSWTEGYLYGEKDFHLWLDEIELWLDETENS